MQSRWQVIADWGPSPNLEASEEAVNALTCWALVMLRYVKNK
jgi:hypothetical protein